MRSLPTFISIISIIVVLFIGGCSSITPKNSLQWDDMTESGYHNGTTAKQANNDLWWQQFHDTQLNDLIDQLFTSNLTLLTAQARLKQSQANLKISTADLLPWLNLSATTERQRTPGVVGYSTGSNNLLQAVAGYEVDLWNKLGAQQEAAAQQQQLSETEINGLYLSLTAQLTNLYFIYQQQQQQYMLADQQYQLRKQYLGFIRDRYDHGLEQSRAVYTARQATDLALNVAQTLRINIVSSEHSIALLLGIRRDQLHLAALADFPREMQQPNIGVPADLLLQRPDVIAAWHQFAAADAQHAAAIAERLPTISLQAGIGLLHNTMGSATISDLFWSLTANTLQPLIDGGKRRANIAKNAAIVEQRRYEAHQTLLNAIYEVEDLLNKISGTGQIINKLEHRYRQVKAHQAHIELQYQHGLDNALHLIEASDATISAKRQLLEIRYQQLNYTIQLSRAVGGTWMPKIRSAKEAS
ncbi:MAG: efflux transporter outer membrane subunit [Thermodesulfobacteriota bacterium]|nr:efflux transporter outer membrane subunit [Thermodesulfobacteriota bacterium]